MTEASRRLLLGVVVLTALVLSAALWRPVSASRTPTAGAELPVTAVSLVCPDIAGGAGVSTTMHVVDVGSLLSPAMPAAQVGYLALDGAGAPRPVVLHPAPVATVSAGSALHAVVVVATGAGAAGVAADQVSLVPGGQGRSLYSSPCLVPGTDWWFAGADGRVGYLDGLLLDNPAPTPANVTVTGWSAGGPVGPPRLSSVTLGPYSRQFIPLAQIAPDQADVALHVRANIGTVTAAVFDRRLHGITPGGSDFDPPTHPPATKLVVSGFIPGPGPRLLQLANPGASDATVTLHLATRGANFEPAGVHTVVVRAAQTLAVNLTAAFGGDGGGVVVTSDLPVLAAGLSQVDASRKLPETAWLPAGQPLTAPAVLASNDPLFGQAVDLVVTAPADAGRLAVKNVSGVTRLVSVPAGRSVVVDLRVLFGTGSRSPGPLLLVPLDRAGLVATRVVYALGAHGVLVTALAPAPVPPPVALPGARYDPRAALR